MINALLGMFNIFATVNESSDFAEVNQPKYYSFATEAIDAANQRFPMGAINRVDVVNEHQLSNEEVIKYFNHLNYFSSTDTKISRMADVSQTTLFGNCGIFTAYGVGYLCDKYKHDRNKPLIETMCLDDHAMLLIGRAPGSDPTKIETWGEDALICDIWANKIYKASEFRMRQRNVARGHEENILSYEGGFADGISSRLSVTQGSYLAGEPTIYKNEGKVSYEQVMTDWYVEDRRRQTELEPLQASSPVPRSLLSDEQKQVLKNSFACITKFDDWKLSERNGLVVCRTGFTPEQIIRVENTLKLTKAVCVSRTTVPLPGGVSIPAIKCESINYQKITQLASVLQVQKPSMDLRSFWQSLGFPPF